MNKPTGTAQEEFAGLFLFALAIVVPVLLLVCGPGETVGDVPPGLDSQQRDTDVIPPEGRTWPVELSASDAGYLIGHFLDCLRALRSGEPLPEAAGAPDSCLREERAPVLVTVYAAGRPRLRALACEGSAVGSVRSAAARVRESMDPGVQVDSACVRLDVLREARAFPVDKRRAFAKRGFAAPLGLGLASGGKLVILMPAEIAEDRAADHAELLETACRDAGLPADAWQDASVTMWRLEARGFVNEGPGSRYALESPRGLAPIPNVTVARLLRASRLAGDYVLHVKQEDGGFLTYWNPASGLMTGCESLTEQAAATAALGVLAGFRPTSGLLETSYEGMSYLMHHTALDPNDGSMAVSRREEVCRDVLELEASAHVLEALCQYRQASSYAAATDAWIRALGQFLLFMQQDDGLFCLRYDPEDHLRTMPKGGEARLAVQAKAAFALCRAYEAAGVPEFLAAAEQAADRMMAVCLDVAEEGSGRRTYGAAEARWLCAAAEALSRLLPTDRYDAWVADVATCRLERQISEGPAAAPDVVGGTLGAFPPKAGATADDLQVFVSACMMDLPDKARYLDAAQLAARYLMQLQYLPENSYYLPDPEAGIGGFREQPGVNIIRLQTVESALRGLVRLARLLLVEASEA